MKSPALSVDIFLHHKIVFLDLEREQVFEFFLKKNKAKIPIIIIVEIEPINSI